MAEATQRYHTLRETALARFLARKAVKAQWRAQGRRRDYCVKELTEAGDDYLRDHPQLLVEAKVMVAALDKEHRAELERIAQKRKARNHLRILVHNSGSKLEVEKC
jgi:hypothetical protein